MLANSPPFKDKTILAFWWINGISLLDLIVLTLYKHFGPDASLPIELETQMILGLITARGGSKTIPRKNVRLLAGKPLIAWTIEAARASNKLDRVIVSTDDAEIAAVSSTWHAEVPFVRPTELAQDLSSHVSVVLHALDWLQATEGVIPDYVMLLQPTVPMRSAEDIDAAIELACDKQADSVISVCLAERHPYLAKKVTEDGRLHDFMYKIEGDLPRQTIETAYALNGAIYLIKPSILRMKKGWYADNTYAYIMPSERSMDIDEAWDFYVADLILKDKRKDEVA